MNVEQIRQKLDLKRIWDDAYYAGRRLISDATYDQLKDELRQAFESDWDEANADVKKKLYEEFTATSFSRLENTFGDTKHDFPMMSLAKSNDINLFFKEVQKWKAAGAKSFIVMWKIDGSSSAYRLS